MHVVILSKGRAETIQTHKLFTNYTLVLHTEEDREEYLKNPTISPEKIVVSNMPPGVANQRQWIQEELIPEGDWYISLDDNIHGFQVVPDDLYSEDFLPVKKDSSLKAAFETPCNSERFLRLCEGLAAKGEKERAYNIGFGTTPNFFFRDKHYRHIGYVISKACVRKNLKTPFALDAQAMEDYAFTAETVLRYGRVLIDNYIFPVAGHYEKGGIGTYAERLPYKIAACEKLKNRYPGFFRQPAKKGVDPKGELAVRFNSEKQVETWRAQMRAAGLTGQETLPYQNAYECDAEKS